MRRHQISAVKRNAMRRQFIGGTLNSHRAAREFGLSSATTWRYLCEFRRIKQQHPEMLKDMNFYVLDAPKPHRPTRLYVEMVGLLPCLLAEENAQVLNPASIWRKYKAICPEGYHYIPFREILRRWMSENVTAVEPRLLHSIPESDQKQLRKWRRSNNHRLWQISVVLNAALAGSTVMEIMGKAGCTRKTVNDWLGAYRAKGLMGFEARKRPPNAAVANAMQTRKDNLTRLIQESPKLYGVNRTSWSITALTAVYNRLHGDHVSYMQISYSLHQLGFRYQKSRDMLTSQDPKFREKIGRIQRTLQRLKPDEKFFSIDEYGPVSVRMKGGVTLTQQQRSPIGIPQNQKSKGYVICTAALELSTNQVTHFYSLKKNTFETIKLIDMLVEQYRAEKRLYLCWDAVSWHNSKILRNHLEDINARQYREENRSPQVIVVPLPSSTQFLNVIESVFGGLARAVIHNSDYESVEKAKEAISLHFEARNQHYLANPKRAGNKIWGKEVVVPQFSDVNICRKRSAMRGAK